jgi:hypothetical protein
VFLVIMLILFRFCELSLQHLHEVAVLRKFEMAQTAKSFMESATTLQVNLRSATSCSIRFATTVNVISNACQAVTNAVGCLAALARSISCNFGNNKAVSEASRSQYDRKRELSRDTKKIMKNFRDTIKYTATGTARLYLKARAKLAFSPKIFGKGFISICFFLFLAQTSTSYCKNQFSQFDPGDRYYFGIDLNNSVDRVVVDRSDTFRATGGSKARSCKKSLSSSRITEFELFGDDLAHLQAIAMPPVSCSQPYAALAFAKRFSSKEEAFNSIRGLKSLGTWLDYTKNDKSDLPVIQQGEYVTDAVADANVSPQLADAFCFSEGWFSKVVTKAKGEEFIVLYFPPRMTSVRNECDPRGGGHPGFILSTAQEIVPINENRFLLKELNTGTILALSLSNIAFCHASRGYFFAVLSKGGFKNALRLVDEEVSKNRIKTDDVATTNKSRRILSPILKFVIEEICHG